MVPGNGTRTRGVQITHYNHYVFYIIYTTHDKNIILKIRNDITFYLMRIFLAIDNRQHNCD